MTNTHPTAQRLFELRSAIRAKGPNLTTIARCIDLTLGVLFPHFCPTLINSVDELERALSQAQESFATSCLPLIEDAAQRALLVERYTELLPELHAVLSKDAEAICAGDPAAKSVDEVMACYPGFFAIAVYRLAHRLSVLEIPLIPRMMTEVAHSRTGIEIHPGAKIGSSFVIDHGTGIVIGETTEIHDNVKLYQGVTLGALSVHKDLQNTKRHPTIESNVVIYANATILGGDTKVGAGSIIGGNVWLTESVPPSSRIYHQSDVRR